MLRPVIRRLPHRARALAKRWLPPAVVDMLRSARRLATGPERDEALAATFRDLLGPPQWCVDTVTVDADGIEIAGWALPPGGRHAAVSFALNGVEFESVAYPLPRPDVAEVFWFVPGAEAAAFRCRSARPAEDVLRGGHAVFTWIDKRTGQPVAPDQAYYYPDDHALPPLPDAARRERIAGHADAVVFRLGGYTLFRRLATGLERYTGKALEQYDSVLDWGCGCGRLTRYLAGLGPGRVTAVDIDADNLAWCRAHLAFADCRLVPLHPPSELAPGAFDLVLGVSVFTHLGAREQAEWLEELARLVPSGGVLLLSTLGAAAVAQSQMTTGQIAAWLRTGIAVSGPNDTLRGHIEDDTYYVTTLLTPEYVRREWSRSFVVERVLPAYLGLQDLVILRKP